MLYNTAVYGVQQHISFRIEGVQTITHSKSNKQNEKKRKKEKKEEEKKKKRNTSLKNPVHHAFEYTNIYIIVDS